MVAILIISALILLNALFVAAEFAIVGAPRAAIDARAAKRQPLARLVQSVLRDPRRQDRYIATAQIGITVASLGLGMYGEHIVAEWIHDWLGHGPVATWLLAHGFASVLAVAILTYFHVVVGEMIPKSLALQSAERMALVITPVMLWIQTLLLPFVVTLNGLGNVVLKAARHQPPGPQPRSVLHLRGAAADRRGVGGTGSDSIGVRKGPPGTVRVRRADGGRSHGSARPHHRDPRGIDAGSASGSSSDGRRARGIRSTKGISTTSSAPTTSRTCCGCC